MCLISVWIVLGIGADDIYVFTDIWRSAPRYDIYHRKVPLKLRMAWSYRKAGSAMLGTSLTTAIAFLGSSGSCIPPIREFGFFTGMLVLINFVLVMTWYPCCLLMNHHVDRCMRMSKACRSKDLKHRAREQEARREFIRLLWGRAILETMNRIQGGGRTILAPVSTKDVLVRPESTSGARCCNAWHSVLYKTRFLWALLWIGMVSYSGTQVLNLRPPTDLPQLFPDEHNVAQWQQAEKFVDLSGSSSQSASWDTENTCASSDCSEAPPAPAPTPNPTAPEAGKTASPTPEERTTDQLNGVAFPWPLPTDKMPIGQLALLPKRPDGLKLKSEGRTVTASWNDMFGAAPPESYVVAISTTNETSWESATLRTPNANTLSVSFQGEERTHYTARVSSYSDGRYSFVSEPATLYLPAVDPDPPGDIKVEMTDDGKTANITWTAVTQWGVGTKEGYVVMALREGKTPFSGTLSDSDYESLKLVDPQKNSFAWSPSASACAAGTTRYVSVIARTFQGVQKFVSKSDISSIKVVEFPATVPDAPSILASTSNAVYVEAGIVISAPACDGGREITEYRIEYNGQKSTTSSAGSYKLTGLQYSTDYVVAVKAFNGEESSPSNELKFSTQDPCPSKPTGKVKTLDYKSVLFSWEGSKDGAQALLTGYLVSIDPAVRVPWEESNLKSSVTVEGLVAETTYTFTVRPIIAKDKELCAKSISAPASNTTHPSPPPIPVDFSFSRRRLLSVAGPDLLPKGDRRRRLASLPDTSAYPMPSATISWKGGDPKYVYEMERQYTLPGSSSTITSDPETCSSSNCTFQYRYGVAYTVRIRVCDRPSCSDWSEPQSLGLKTSIPEPPTGLFFDPSKITLTGYQLTWGKPWANGEDITGYYVSESIADGAEEIIYVEGNSYVKNGLNPETKAVYKVLAINSKGNSSWSSNESVATQAKIARGDFQLSDESAVVYKNETMAATKTFQVANSGEGILSVASISTDVSWITRINPSFFNLQPEATKTVSLSIDPSNSDLQSGENKATITLSHSEIESDATSSSFVLTLDVRVVEVLVSESEIELRSPYGGGPLKVERQLSAPVTNTHPVDITAFSASGSLASVFSDSTSGVVVTIQPGSSVDVSFLFAVETAPSEIGKYFGRISMAHTAGTVTLPQFTYDVEIYGSKFKLNPTFFTGIAVPGQSELIKVTVDVDNKESSIPLQVNRSLTADISGTLTADTAEESFVVSPGKNMILDFTINPASLAEGGFKGEIAFVTNASIGTANRNFELDLTVVDTKITASETTVSKQFLDEEDGFEDTTKIELANDSPDTAYIISKIQSTAGWLQAKLAATLPFTMGGQTKSDLQMIINTKGVSAGSHSGTVTVTHNSPLPGSTIVISVQIVIEATPRLRIVSPSQITAGYKIDDTAIPVKLVLQNTGSAVALISALEVANSPATTIDDASVKNVGQGSKEDFEFGLKVNSDWTGSVSGDISITYNHPRAPKITIPFSLERIKPELSISEANIVVGGSTAAGQNIATRTIVITNVGTGVLEVSISQPPQSWLSLQDTSLSVTAKKSADIRMTLDATGLDYVKSPYTQELEITHNDEDKTSPLKISITYNLAAGKLVLDVDQTEVNRSFFVDLPNQATATFTAENVNDKALTISGFEFSGNPSWITTDFTTPKKLAAKSSTTVTLRYDLSSQEVGRYTTTVSLLNDGETGTQTLDVNVLIRAQQCPVGKNGKPCSANGICGGENCTCSDSSRFLGLTCEECPVNPLTYRVCSGASCQLNATGYAKCACDSNTIGEWCAPCPVSGDVVCAGHGECSLSGDVGICTCEEGWIGADCSLQCTCTKHGRCELPVGSNTPICVCEAGYLGANCSQTCGQQCSGQGQCKLGDDEIAACECNSEYTGNICEARCPFDTTITASGDVSVAICNDRGTCKAPETAGGNATCECQEGFTGIRCENVTQVEKPKPRLSPDLAITLSFVWGISSADYSKVDKNDPTSVPIAVYDTAFNLSATEAQMYMIEICDTLWNMEDQVRASHSKCPMYGIREFATEQGYGFPVDPKMLSLVVLQGFKEQRLNTHSSNFGMSDDGSKITWMRVEVKTYIERRKGGVALEVEYQRWEEWMKKINEAAPASMKKGFQTAEEWPRMVVEIAFISGTITQLGISLGSSLIAMFIFTQNWILSFLGILLMFGTILAMLAFFVLMGWTVGAVEAVSLSIIIGLSVDYVLHLGHSYNHSTSPDRITKTKQALVELGTSVFASALTTIGSMVILTLCTIKLFNVMGIIIAVTVGVAIFSSLGPFCAVLCIIGPEKDAGKLTGCCRGRHEKRKAELFRMRSSFGLYDQSSRDLLQRKSVFEARSITMEMARKARAENLPSRSQAIEMQRTGDNSAPRAGSAGVSRRVADGRREQVLFDIDVHEHSSEESYYSSPESADEMDG